MHREPIWKGSQSRATLIKPLANNRSKKSVLSPKVMLRSVDPSINYEISYQNRKIRVKMQSVDSKPHILMTQGSAATLADKEQELQRIRSKAFHEALKDLNNQSLNGETQTNEDGQNSSIVGVNKKIVDTGEEKQEVLIEFTMSAQPQAEGFNTLQNFGKKTEVIKKDSTTDFKKTEDSFNVAYDSQNDFIKPKKIDNQAIDSENKETVANQAQIPVSILDQSVNGASGNQNLSRNKVSDKVDPSTVNNGPPDDSDKEKQVHKIKMFETERRMRSQMGDIKQTMKEPEPVEVNLDVPLADNSRLKKVYSRLSAVSSKKHFKNTDLEDELQVGLASVEMKMSRQTRQMNIQSKVKTSADHTPEKITERNFQMSPSYSHKGEQFIANIPRQVSQNIPKTNLNQASKRMLQLLDRQDSDNARSLKDRFLDTVTPLQSGKVNDGTTLNLNRQMISSNSLMNDKGIDKSAQILFIQRGSGTIEQPLSPKFVNSDPRLQDPRLQISNIVEMARNRKRHLYNPTMLSSLNDIPLPKKMQFPNYQQVSASRPNQRYSKSKLNKDLMFQSMMLDKSDQSSRKVMGDKDTDALLNSLGMSRYFDKNWNKSTNSNMTNIQEILQSRQWVSQQGVTPNQDNKNNVMSDYQSLKSLAIKDQQEPSASEQVISPEIVAQKTFKQSELKQMIQEATDRTATEDPDGKTKPPSAHGMISRLDQNTISPQRMVSPDAINQRTITDEQETKTPIKGQDGNYSESSFDRDTTDQMHSLLRPEDGVEQIKEELQEIAMNDTFLKQLKLDKTQADMFSRTYAGADIKNMLTSQSDKLDPTQTQRFIQQNKHTMNENLIVDKPQLNSKEFVLQEQQQAQQTQLSSTAQPVETEVKVDAPQMVEDTPQNSMPIRKIKKKKSQKKSKFKRLSPHMPRVSVKRVEASTETANDLTELQRFQKLNIGFILQDFQAKLIQKKFVEASLEHYMPKTTKNSKSKLPWITKSSTFVMSNSNFDQTISPQDFRQAMPSAQPQLPQVTSMRASPSLSPPRTESNVGTMPPTSRMLSPMRKYAEYSLLRELAKSKNEKHGRVLNQSVQLTDFQTLQQKRALMSQSIVVNRAKEIFNSTLSPQLTTIMSQNKFKTKQSLSKLEQNASQQQTTIIFDQKMMTVSLPDSQNPNVILAPHGVPIPINRIQEEIKRRNFPDLDTRTQWPIDVAIKHSFKSRREALIQIPGNWQIFKQHNDLEVYKCAQCKTYVCMLQKHGFAEVSIVTEEGNSAAWHEPYDEKHQKIGKEHHTSVVQFIKKYAKLGSSDPLMVSQFIKILYPKLHKYFQPDIRDIFEISYREYAFDRQFSTRNNTNQFADLNTVWNKLSRQLLSKLKLIKPQPISLPPSPEPKHLTLQRCSGSPVKSTIHESPEKVQVLQTLVSTPDLLASGQSFKELMSRSDSNEPSRNVPQAQEIIKLRMESELKESLNLTRKIDLSQGLDEGRITQQLPMMTSPSPEELPGKRMDPTLHDATQYWSQSHMIQTLNKETSKKKLFRQTLPEMNKTLNIEDRQVSTRMEGSILGSIQVPKGKFSLIPEIEDDSSPLVKLKRKQPRMVNSNVEMSNEKTRKKDSKDISYTAESDVAKRKKKILQLNDNSGKPNQAPASIASSVTKINVRSDMSKTGMALFQFGQNQK